MADTLYNKIVVGLDGAKDGNKFEACANSLLREKYPWLTWIKGGNDAGFDGAGAAQGGSRVQLVCTTDKDVIGNVTNSLERTKAEGQKSDTVLVATSRNLSPEQKRNIQKRIEEYGKSWLPIEDQPAFAELIYHSSRWRIELLNIPGNSPPLSRFPVSDRIFLPLAPIGRDTEIAQLKATTTDLVVFGQPGSGKTHLLAHVAKDTEGLFVVSSTESAILDGIRDEKPKWLIIDDALSSLATMRLLKKFRQETGAVFRVVATCWPGQEAEVAAVLGIADQKPLDLGLLTPLDIKNIIVAAGIGGPDHLLTELIAQANGKPGLAVTLARLCSRDTIKDVFTGQALARDVKKSLVEMAGKDAVGLLGFFALSGDAGLDIATAAKLAERPQETVRQQAVTMGAAGILQVLHNGHLAIEPIRLRQALVAEVFCVPGLSLDWESFLPAMPSKGDALETIICGTMIAEASDDARLQKHILAVAKGGGGIRDACRIYCELGRYQALWVLEQFPELLDHVAGPALEHAPKEVIPLILEEDLRGGDAPFRSRERLKSLAKWIGAVALKPETVKRRELVLNAVLGMQDCLRNTATLLAALDHVFSLRFEWISNPPGQSMTMTITSGAVKLDYLPAIGAFWPRALPLLKDLPAQQTAGLLAIIGDWVFPDHALQKPPPAAYLQVARNIGTAMFNDLIAAYADRWAVLRRFDHMAEELGITLPSDRNPLAAILFPGRTNPREAEESEAQRAAATALAHEWLARGPDSATIRAWIECERLAGEHNVSYPNLGNQVAWEISRAAGEISPWFTALLQEGLPAHLLWSVALRACRENPATLSGFVHEYRSHPEYGPLAIECLLLFAKPDSADWNACLDDLPKHASKVGVMVLRNQLDDPTIHWFLRHGNGQTIREVTSNLWSADPVGVIPAELLEDWKAGVVSHLAEDHEWEGIAPKYPELACAWLKQRMNQTFEEHYAAEENMSQNHYRPQIIRALTEAQRIELIEHFNEGSWESGLLAEIIGEDAKLIRHALGRPATKNFVGASLGSPLDSPHGWPERAIVLFENGWSLEDVFRASSTMESGWIGRESDATEKRRVAYLQFAQHADQRIRDLCAFADNYLGQRCEAEKKRERRAEIRGSPL